MTCGKLCRRQGPSWCFQLTAHSQRCLSLFARTIRPCDGFLKACRDGQRPLREKVLARDSQGFAPEHSATEQLAEAIPPTWQHTCPTCGKLFPNKRTCAVHRARAHGEATLEWHSLPGLRFRRLGKPRTLCSPQT